MANKRQQKQWLEIFKQTLEQISTTNSKKEARLLARSTLAFFNTQNREEDWPVNKKISV